MTRNMETHEQFDRSEQVKGSSDRSFGLTFAAAGVIIALWPSLHGEPPRWWFLPAVVGLTAISMVAPHLLAPLNRAWLRVGLLLNRVVSPILLGVVFYGVIAPIGTVLRAAGKNPLQLRFEKSTPSYWILRTPPGPPPKSMTRQF